MRPFYSTIGPFSRITYLKEIIIDEAIEKALT